MRVCERVMGSTPLATHPAEIDWGKFERLAKDLPEIDGLTHEALKEKILSQEYFYFDYPSSMVITHGYTQNNHAIFCFVAAAGDLTWLRLAEKELSEWAKANNYQHITMLGRMGWKKVFPEYTPHLYLTKKLQD